MGRPAREPRLPDRFEQQLAGDVSEVVDGALVEVLLA